MNTRGTVHYLLTIILFFTGVTYTRAQQYDHKIIAILPINAHSYKLAPSANDSAFQQAWAREASLGIDVQEALFNSITADSSKLLVDVQDWRVTDSLLQMARLDLRKVTYMDKVQLAQLLKVDAILAGKLEIIDLKKYGTNSMANVSVTLGVMQLMGAQRRLTMQLYDGPSGNELWSFEKTVQSNKLFDRDKKIEDKLFRSFVKKFPYTR